MSTSQLVGGIDVAKAHLDIALRPTGECWSVANEEASIAVLVARLQAAAPRLHFATSFWARGDPEEVLEVLAQLQPADSLIAGYRRAARVLAARGPGEAIWEQARGARPGWDPAGAHNALGILYNDLGICLQEEASSTSPRRSSKPPSSWNPRPTG